MQNKKWKRVLALFVMTLIFFSATSITSFASLYEGNKVYARLNLAPVKDSGTPRDWIVNPNGYDYYKYVNGKGNVVPLHMIYAGDKNGNFYRDDNGNILWSYCIEYGASGDSFKETTATAITDTAYWWGLSYTAQYGITYAQMYGYPANSLGVSACDAYAATQAIIWEYQLGYRSLDGTLYNGFFYYTIIAGTPAESAYWELANMIATHHIVPSFSNQAGTASTTMSYNPSTGRYEAWLYDYNNVLKYYDMSTNNPNVGVYKDGNSLLLYSYSQVSGVQVIATKNTIHTVAQAQMILWNNANQPAIIGRASDPVYASLTVATAQGNIAVTKQAEDGQNISGRTFSVVGNGLTYYVTTGSDGNGYLWGIPTGFYTVTEINCPAQYNQPSSQYILVNNGQTSYATFNNVLKKGNLIVTKTAEDGQNTAGRTFNVEGMGSKYTITTGSDGKAYLNNIKIGSYTVTETNCPIQYNQPQTVTVSIDNYQTTNSTVNNTLKKGYIKIEKSDKETGKALAGTVFGIFTVSGSQVGTITTGSDGTATSGLLPYGDYYLQEVQASTGYIADTAKINFSIANNGETIVKSMSNMSQKYKIEVTKTGEVLTGFTESDTPQGKLNTPVYTKQNLDNCIVEIFADEDITTADGTVRYTKGQLVDTITTNSTSSVYSIDLYRGKYLVKEKNAPTGYFIGLNEANITLANKDEAVIFNNDRQKLDIDLTKIMEENEQYPNKDAYKDVVFGVYTKEDIKASDGKILLDKDKLVDIINIDKDGKDITAADLPIGKYYIKEIKTAEGYILINKEYDVDFPAQEQNTDIYTVDLGKIENKVYRGSIDITKYSNFDGRLLSSAEYGIYNASTNKLVGKVTTGTDGTGVYIGLPYGKYYLQEINAPNKYLLDTTKYYFEINGKKVIEKQNVYNAPKIGYLTPSITGQPTITITETPIPLAGSPNIPNIPDTSDATNPATFIMTAAISIAGLGYIILNKKKGYKK